MWIALLHLQYHIKFKPLANFSITNKNFPFKVKVNPTVSFFRVAVSQGISNFPFDTPKETHPITFCWFFVSRMSIGYAGVRARRIAHYSNTFGPCHSPFTDNKTNTLKCVRYIRYWNLFRVSHCMYRKSNWVRVSKHYFEIQFLQCNYEQRFQNSETHKLMLDTHTHTHTLVINLREPKLKCN